MWRAQGWFVNMFEVDAPAVASADGAAASLTLSWTHGGFQGGRGWQVDGDSGAIDPTPQLYVENVFEELDEPDEWYYDAATRELFLCYNGTGAPPDDLQFVATNLPRLIELVGTADDPVRDVAITGVGLRDTSYTYMDPWGVPSGGDWSLHRGAAVFLEGTVNATVSDCLFKRLDGNGLLFSGYNRDGVVDANEFVWIGDTAMGAWGRTDEWDGTSGEQPRGINVTRNFAHELGIYELQSAMWFQAKAAQTALDECVAIIREWGLDGPDGHGEEAALREFPPAVLISSAQVCHPYRVQCAWRTLRRVAPLVGRWRRALVALHVEVAHRPGNSGMRAAMDEFAACAQKEVA